MDEFKEPQTDIEDQVLQFLAENHPDDEQSLDELTTLLSEATGVTDSRIMELAYKGSRYQRDIDNARQEGYLKGRNENIEMETRRRSASIPSDDGGLPDEAPDLPLLRHMRRSVWDD